MTKTRSNGVLNVGADGEGFTMNTRSRDSSGKKGKDAIKNPPSPLKYLDDDPDNTKPCKRCKKCLDSRDDAIQCDKCSSWLHVKCTALSRQQFEFLSRNFDPNIKWICEPCLLDKASGFSNQDAQMAKQGAQIDLLVRVIFDMQTQITNMQSEMSTLTELMNKKTEVDKIEHPDLGDMQIQMTDMKTEMSTMTELLKKNSDIDMKDTSDMGNQKHAHYVAEALEEQSERNEKKEQYNNVQSTRVRK